MEITVNARQVIAVIWTIIAIAISLIVVLGMGFPTTFLGGSFIAGAPWWLMVAAFFGAFLIITVPVYLLIAIWGIATVRYEEEERE
jgi:uncharacterized membrane protein